MIRLDIFANLNDGKFSEVRMTSKHPVIGTALFSAQIKDLISVEAAHDGLVFAIASIKTERIRKEADYFLFLAKNFLLNSSCLCLAFFKFSLNSGN